MQICTYTFGSIGTPYERRNYSYNERPRGREEIFRTEPQRAYDAAGEIPTIKIGRLLRVPIRALEAMLDRTSERAV